MTNKRRTPQRRLSDFLALCVTAKNQTVDKTECPPFEVRIGEDVGTGYSFHEALDECMNTRWERSVTE